MRKHSANGVILPESNPLKACPILRTTVISQRPNLKHRCLELEAMLPAQASQLFSICPNMRKHQPQGQSVFSIAHCPQLLQYYFNLNTWSWTQWIKRILCIILFKKEPHGLGINQKDGKYDGTVDLTLCFSWTLRRYSILSNAWSSLRSRSLAASTLMPDTSSSSSSSGTMVLCSGGHCCSSCTHISQFIYTAFYDPH